MDTKKDTSSTQAQRRVKLEEWKLKKSQTKLNSSLPTAPQTSRLSGTGTKTTPKVETKKITTPISKDTTKDIASRLQKKRKSSETPMKPQILAQPSKKSKDAVAENKENVIANHPLTPEQPKLAEKPKLNLTPQTNKSVVESVSPSREHHHSAEIEKYKEEIKNLKTALSLLQRTEPKEERPQVQQIRDQRKFVQQTKLLKKLLKRTVEEKQSLEVNLRNNKDTINKLQSHIIEITLLYEASKMSNENLKDDHLSQSLSYCLEERNEEVKKLNKDIENLTEENNALKFSNQLWLQRMGEMRGKYLTMLQDAHKQNQIIESDLKADAAAWNELMNTTIKQLQEKMAEGLRESVTQIAQLEAQLEVKTKEWAQLKEEMLTLKQQQTSL